MDAVALVEEAQLNQYRQAPDACKRLYNRRVQAGGVGLSALVRGSSYSVVLRGSEIPS